MINAIFAMDCIGSLGLENDFPWPQNIEYQKWFQSHVYDQILVVGRRGWEVLLKNRQIHWPRHVYVATHQNINPGARIISGDLIEQIKSIEQKHPARNIFIGGGKSLLETTRHIVDHMHIAHIKGPHRADTRLYPGYFLSGFQAYRAQPTISQTCTFLSYKNIFET